MEQGGQNKFNLKLKELGKKPIITHPEHLMESGKVMPQSVELEEALLGALMLERDAYTKVAEFLFKEVFYKDQHQVIFGAIMSLSELNEPIDLLSVTNELKRLGKLELVGGAYYLSQLTYRVASSANIEYYARILLQKFLQRKVISLCTETIHYAFEDGIDIFDLVDHFTKIIFELVETVTKSKEKDIKNLIDETLNTIKELRDKKDGGGITGIPSGLKDLDRVTNGWQNSHFIIIAARPGMGKSALMITLAKNAAIENKIPTAIFSLEMTAQDIVKRLLAAQTKMPIDKFTKAQLQDYEIIQISDTLEKIKEAPLYIDESEAVSLMDIRTKARRLKVQHGIKFIIIDYLQLMHNRDDKNGNREQEISSISRGLKSLAKELNIPIIALSQVNRAVEKEANKRPKLADLRESGSLEQDTDMVLFIYRPEYYSKNDTADFETKMGYIDIAKNRHGATAEIQLGFEGIYSRFCNYDDVKRDEEQLSENKLPTNTDFLGESGPIFSSKMNKKDDNNDISDVSRNQIEDF